MASPIFHRFLKRYTIQRMDVDSNRWTDSDTFGDRASAERVMREMVNKDPSIRAGRVFDQITSQAGSTYTSER